MAVFNENVVSIVYNRTYKLIKLKTESAYELLSSVKKIITQRITEMELSRIDPNKG